MNRMVKWMLPGLLTLGACDAPEPPVPASPPPPPNVILFVGDGFGVGAWSLGREWARHRGVELVLDGADHVGFLETHCADALVTDSAAAATAWSTAKLGLRFAIGDQGEPRRPSLFERLRAAGYAQGFVTTARVTHATPAPFYANVENRRLENDIAARLVEFAPTVAIGGGARHFLPGGKRTDGVDLFRRAESAGTAVMREFSTPLPTDRPVLVVLESSHLPHELDRGDRPDLPELVLAAIDRLNAESRPWFLLVEESRIDSACHDHDGPGVAANVLRLDRAVAAALEHVNTDSTLVVVTADHCTTSPTWHEAAKPESLDVISMSVERMERLIFGGEAWSGTPRALEEVALPVLDEGARQTGLTAQDLDRLVVAESYYDRRTAIGKAVSRRLGISFLPYRDHLSSSEVHGHTADPVPVRAWGVRAAEVAGVRDHAEFGRWLVDVMGLEERGEGASYSRSVPGASSD